MLSLVMFFIFLAIGAGIYRFQKVPMFARIGVSAFCVMLAIVFAGMTSVVRIGGDEVGVVRKIYGTNSLPAGKLIATKGETGYQSDIIPPGAFRVSLFFNVFNEVTTVPLVKIPQGFYGRVVTTDGLPLDEGHVMADAWLDADSSKFLDATYFLEHNGHKGLQAGILKPGSYPINLALYNVRVGYTPNGRDIKTSIDDVYDMRGKTNDNTPLTTEITRIPSGFVGVVRSNITDVGAKCTDIKANTVGDGLVARLVPRGCTGIWADSLSPGDYYLNRDAYDVTLVDTRVQTLEFKGGYLRRYIDLKVDQKGDFQQTERPETREVPKDAADSAVFTKVEGWEVPQELRVLAQVRPEHAPLVVAAVGGLPEVERRIIIPAIRSHVRNVFGGSVDILIKGKKENRPTQILDLVEHRSELENEIQSRANDDGQRAGVDIKEIRLGDSVIPPELLLARQREQLAQQLTRAYEQEKIAQVTRQTSEQARVTADKQGDLVQAQIEVKKAELNEQRRAADGRAERAYLEQQAAGQTAQAEVLGRDSVLRLQIIKIVTESLVQHPEILGNLKLPSTVVIGSGGLEGAIATFGGMFGATGPDTTKPAQRLLSAPQTVFSPPLALPAPVPVR